MDSEASSKLNRLERMLLDESIDSTDLPISLLKTITNDFSDDLHVGSGGFAVVYKGFLGNGGIVAVKKLFNRIDMDETKYNQEVGCLMNIRHKNIVRFLGYCADTQGKMIDYGGKFVMADVRQRLLCFEYLHKGNLGDYITDASQGMEWRKRYNILKGICEGLCYLHETHIVHLDLKPTNILLDDNMVPKISDFGLSRCFDENQSRAITSKLYGTLGYLAPEFHSGVITFKSDIYSLGVIFTEILTGQKGYLPVDEVLQNWRDRFSLPSADALLEQVRVCTEISIDCLNFDPEKRPFIQHIIKNLNETERTCQYIEFGINTSLTAQMETQEKETFRMQCDELVVPETGTIKKGLLPAGVTEDMLSKQNAGDGVDKLKSLVLYEAAESQASCPVSMTPKEISLANFTESLGPFLGSEKKSTCFDSSKVRGAQQESQRQQNKEPEDAITQKIELLSAKPLQLRFHWKPNNLLSSCLLHLTNNTDAQVAFRILTKNPEEYFLGPLYGLVLPRSMYTLQVTACKQFDDELFTLESTKYHRDESPDNGKQYDNFFKNAKDKGREVQQVNLSVITGHEPRNMIIHKYLDGVLSITLHPTETWIAASNRSGICQIWDYSAQETLCSFQVDAPGIFYLPTIFIAQKQWLLVGDTRGYMNVYSYTNTMEKIDALKAHDGDITSLDIHPTEPYVLSASDDGLIKLWYWEKDWECVRTFDTFQQGNYVKFNPKNAMYFTNITASTDEVQIWNTGSYADGIQIRNICSSCCKFRTITRRSCTPIDYFTRGDDLFFIIGHGDGSATIWDWQSRACVKTLYCHKALVRTVCAHPDLPILITGSLDGTVRLWNSITFELQGILDCGLGDVEAVACLKESRRIMIGHLHGLAMIEIDYQEQGRGSM